MNTWDGYEYRNPSSLRNAPMYSFPSDEVDVEKIHTDAKATVAIMFTSEQIRAFGAIIVMCWDHAAPKDAPGSKRRRYQDEFSDQERKIIRGWHAKMYTWELRSGYPQRIGMRVSTYRLLKRAADFFASV